MKKVDRDIIGWSFDDTSTKGKIYKRLRYEVDIPSWTAVIRHTDKFTTLIRSLEITNEKDFIL